MGISPNTPQRWWQDNPAPTLSQPQNIRRWRRQGPEHHHKEEQYPWRRRDGPALSPCGGSWVLACSWRCHYRHQCTTPCLHFVTTSQQPQHLTRNPFSYNTEKLLKFCNEGVIWGKASGYECMVLMLRWCGYPDPENSECGVLLRVRYMRVSSTNSIGECTLIFICRRDEAKLSGIRRWVLLVGHSTIEVHY